MADLLTTTVLVIIGAILGKLIGMGGEFLENHKIFGSAPTDNLYSLIIGIFYFTTLFSIPMSGNIPLFIVAAGIFLYALYGRFAANKNRPLKPEDKVITKWYSGFP